MNYYALTIILSPRPDAKNREVLGIFKAGNKYKAFYEIDEYDQGWFIPPNGTDFNSMFWLTPQDGKNHSDFRNEKYIMDNFYVINAANYSIDGNKTSGIQLL